MHDLEDKTVISAQVPTPLRDNLARLADEHDRSLSAEMRRAIELHLHLAEFSQITERRTSGSTVGSGSSADHASSAVGLGSSVGAGGSLPSRPQAPAERRAPESSTASRPLAGDDR